mgnify:CR=1 FL=1
MTAAGCSENYGVGVQVEFDNLFEAIAEKYKVDVESAEGYALECLDDLITGTDYNYFELGEGFYTGQPNEVYIEVNDVFKDGYNITEKVTNLIKFCEDNGLTMVGEVGVVGGLEIY